MAVIIFIIHFIGNAALYIQTQNNKIIILYCFELLLFVLVLCGYQWIYPGLSKLLIRNILLLISIGFIIQLRLSFDNAQRHLIMVSLAFVLSLIIPSLIENLSWLNKLGWIYGVISIVILLIVFFYGNTQYGATNWLEIRGHVFQPSEFVKIIYVFAIAALFSEGTDFKRVLIVSVMAAANVLTLVIERDLGGALIFYVTYVFILYFATKKSVYLFSGLLAGSLASYIAYNLFAHVKVRVLAWQNPIGLIDKEGFQVSQSLFAIGTGGWFGMGINRGMPNNIPVVDSDFVFSALSEEFGALFVISLILIYVNTFLMMIIISFKIKDMFYRLLSLGFSILFAFQTFLCIGGVIKFIPSTGVTLPLISYGGSSIISTIIMFMIIQGIQLKFSNDGAKSDFNKQNKAILKVIYIFLGLFVIMIGYFTKFLLFDRGDFINNAYNKRNDVLEEIVVRGDILTSDGTAIATTKTNDDGSEQRIYPYDNLFAHVVGRVSKGRSGIEESENIRLLTAEINSVESLINELSGKKNKANNIITTLDLDLQKIASSALGDNKGAVVVMEPSTGKILAMVSKPDYNPNIINDIWDNIKDDTENSVLMNRATQGKYPPGSTFKIMTALSYIRNNPSYLEYKYNCKGKTTNNNMTIHCYNGKVHGEVDLYKATVHSCNTFYANIGKELDLDSFYGLCQDFYFNKNLPININNSASVYSLTKESASISDIMQTSIGQGETLITPLHNAMIISTIANRGTMMKPYVVDRIEEAGGRIVKQNKAKELAKPISRMESIVLSKMLRGVVTEGTASDLNKLKVKVAGKTGSAEQKDKPAHAWFIGYAPYDNPEIAISVIVESKGTGSSYAVPIAKKILNVYFDN
ncbi:MAG TPA: FtsW/RodA/SpoVE family cell cycle protein [Clostridiales bacterium]|nr:FtsW/RodA/SpoVE family cell cycle protein [Clostridiales bacterium]